MNEETRADIGAMLMKLDFVTWDRFINPNEDEYFIYGWIPRNEYPNCGACMECEDVHAPRADFVVLSWYHGNWWYLTSSRTHTDSLAKIIDGTEEDYCKHQPVEAEFDIPNMIKL